MKILVSACLLGENCKYNGKNNYSERVAKYLEGQEEALRIAKENGIDLAILQSRSPSCGVKQIYDGSFTGKLIPGHGVFAQLLEKNGFRVMDCEEI